MVHNLWPTQAITHQHMALPMSEALQQPHTPQVQLHICNRSGPHVPVMNVFLSKAAALFELKMCTAGAGLPAVSSHSPLLQGSSLKALWVETDCSIHRDRGSRELEKTASQQKPRNEGSLGKRKRSSLSTHGLKLLKNGKHSPLVELMPHMAFHNPSVVWELDSIYYIIVKSPGLCPQALSYKGRIRMCSGPRNNAFILLAGSRFT